MKPKPKPPECLHPRAYEIGFRANDRAILFFCPGCKNVFINSPSPQTVRPENFLNQGPSGTAGWVSSQRASRMSCSCEMWR